MSDSDLAKKVVKDGMELLNAIARYFIYQGGNIGEIIIVPLIISARIFRLHEAALQLVESKFPIEAGILALSQFEAKLDLGQAVDDVKWCAQWLEHQNSKRSITTNITDTVTKLYPTQAMT